MEIIGTKENFDIEVMHSDKTVLVDFWAAWCGPCRMIAPILEEISDEYGEVKVVKVNVDEQGELADRFEIMSIPTLFVIEDGQIIEKLTGVRPKAEILTALGL